MEVLLLQDIKGVGKKNDLLIVGDGYAMNFLLPHSKALIATPTVRRRFAEHIKKRALEAETERSKAATAAQLAKGKELVFTRKVTKTGKLYAAITEKHIIEEILAKTGTEVKEKDVTLAEHIKSTGDFTATVAFKGIDVEIAISVKAEK
jgi:large subunit ribosomal protein L9